MLQAQVKVPGTLTQVASAWQSSSIRAHSLMSVQVTPSPVQPAVQVHMKRPGGVMQVASAQLVPLPVQPGLQAQEKPPGVLAQVALASQSSVPRAHSSSSVQVSPS